MSVIGCERCALLVEELAARAPLRNQPWARVALALAASAIRRGRLLTDAEQLRNLASAVEADGTDELTDLAAALRREAAAREGEQQ